MPIRIIMSTIIPGFISSTIRYNLANVAPANAITVVIHEVLSKTLARLASNIKCGVPRGGCWMFFAGLYVDRLKHARISVSGTTVKLFLI